MTAPIYLITGVMAAGKSTVAQAIAERLPKSVHLRGDAFRKFIVNGQAVMNERELSEEGIAQLRLRQKIAAEVACKYSDAGFTVALQDIYMGDDLLKMVYRLGERPVHVVVLCPSEEAVRQREEMRPKTGYKPDGLQPGAMVDILRTETPAVGLWLNTSNLTIEQTVDAILDRRDEALVSR